MIEVYSKPAIEPHRKGGWELVFWTGKAFDHSTPFRDMLSEIAAILNQETPTSLELPGYHPLEDDVEGVLRFGGEAISVYYEYTLSYLAFMSDSPTTLRRLADRLQPVVALAA